MPFSESERQTITEMLSQTVGLRFPFGPLRTLLLSWPVEKDLDTGTV
jgi:hypothetical protein